MSTDLLDFFATYANFFIVIKVLVSTIEWSKNVGYVKNTCSIS